MKNTPKAPPYSTDILDEVFVDMGLRLFLLQNLEAYIDFVAKAVFADNNEEAKKALLNADPKTMGQLLVILRKRVNIEEAFDDRLRRTLKARNLFVHEFSVKYDLRTKNGITKANQFLCDTMDDLEEVSNVMKALIISFGKEIGVSDPELESNWRKHGDLKNLEKIHIPKLKEVFEKK